MRKAAKSSPQPQLYEGIDMAGRAAAKSFDLKALPEDFVADPFRYYHALRLYSSAHRCPDGSLFLTRYDDVLAVYRDTEGFSSDKQLEFKPIFEDSSLYEHHTSSLVFNDPPLHTRVRRAIVGALGPRATRNLRTELSELVDGLLDNIGEAQSFDAIDDFAALIPVEVIGNLLRVPREDREPLRQWSLAILGALEPQPSKEQLDVGNRAVDEFLAYLEKLIAERKQHLDRDDNDVLSRLIRESIDDRAGISHRELLHNCIFILNAGHETTTNLIGNGIAILADDPTLRERLLHDPSLWKTTLEEMLRYQSPNQLGNRIAVRDRTLGEIKIEAGTRISLCIGAANRDPQVFDCPDQFQPYRTPNPHLAFGNGIHLCAGLNVARLEAEVALQRLLEAMPELHPNGAATLTGRVRFRGFKNLPVRRR